jgi:hypothetical protein
LRQNLQQVAPNQEKPHTTPLHSLIYSIYISVVGPSTTLAWPSWKQPGIAVRENTARLDSTQAGSKSFV